MSAVHPRFVVFHVVAPPLLRKAVPGFLTVSPVVNSFPKFSNSETMMMCPWWRFLADDDWRRFGCCEVTKIVGNGEYSRDVWLWWRNQTTLEDSAARIQGHGRWMSGYIDGPRQPQPPGWWLTAAVTWLDEVHRWLGRTGTSWMTALQRQHRSVSAWYERSAGQVSPKWRSTRKVGHGKPDYVDGVWTQWPPWAERRPARHLTTGMTLLPWLEQHGRHHSKISGPGWERGCRTMLTESRQPHTPWQKEGGWCMEYFSSGRHVDVVVVMADGGRSVDHLGCSRQMVASRAKRPQPLSYICLSILENIVTPRTILTELFALGKALNNKINEQGTIK